VTAAVAAAVAVIALGGLAGCPAPSASGAAVPKYADLNHAPGEMVEIEAYLVPGRVTIVDFRADWCGACDRIEAMLRADLASDDAIVVRRVDVGAGSTPVARAYQVGALPHLRIFDRDRRMRYVLVGNDAIRTAELARGLLAE